MLQCEDEVKKLKNRVKSKLKLRAIQEIKMQVLDGEKCSIVDGYAERSEEALSVTGKAMQGAMNVR
jgi:hypothetical protein